MHDTIVRLADVWKTCNKIRAAAFRVGLNLWDWYRPLDPEGNSLISESKFVSVLAGPLRSVIGLSEAEIAQVADYFRAQDGRVLYHQLCQVIHGEDAGGAARPAAQCALEACPAPAPPRCRRLDAWQARRLCCLLATIAQRDIPFRPYFQDYELVAKNDGRITFAHFARILNFVGVLVSPEDFNLLVRRYIKDSYTIDYVEFLREIEAVKKDGIQGLGPEYQHPQALIDTRPPPTPQLPAPRAPPTSPSPSPAPDLAQLMLRVQRHVLERRVRVSEFFRDYDPLGCGRVSAQQFARALDAAGLRAALSAADARRLARCYADAADPARVCWRTFEDDCDQVFTIKELEKHPTVTPGMEGAAAAREGEGEGGASSDVLERVRARVSERSVDLRPLFRDHDKRGTGHVSRAQFQRVVGALGVVGDDAAALECAFQDQVGVNYYALLHELEDEAEPIAPPSAAVARGPRAPPDRAPALTDIVQILAKIKGKMVREGVRPQQFLQQFDRARAGVVTRAQFQRGVAAAALPLHPLELDTLMEVFSAPGRRQLVEYARLCAAAGGALTQGGLERAPLLAPLPTAAHAPPAPPAHLDYEERAVVAKALDKLANFPDRTSSLLDVFKEADRSNSGRVSRALLERALARSDVLALLSSRERDVLCKCFSCPQLGNDEVNYRALCNTLDVLHATSSAQPC